MALELVRQIRLTSFGIFGNLSLEICCSKRKLFCKESKKHKEEVLENNCGEWPEKKLRDFLWVITFEFYK